MGTSSRENEYFDHHTYGVGLIRDIRTVTPAQGNQRNAFLACRITALRGLKVSPNESYYDVKVVGTEAQELIRKCEQPEKAGCEIFAEFKIGDVYSEAFTYKEGPNTGNLGSVIKGRLLKLYRIEVDGVEVHNARSSGTQEEKPGNVASGSQDRASSAAAAAVS